MPLIKINDDKGNPLNVGQQITVLTGGKTKGNSTLVDQQTNKLYPKGFTPPMDFVSNPQVVDSDGMPIEMGSYNKNNYTNKSSPSINNKKNKDYLRNSNKNDELEFKYGLDYDLDINDNKSIPKPIIESGSTMQLNLGSFVHTGNDNEDPTVFGYDIVIDVNKSPLFNGALLDFLTKYSSMSELSSRIDIYNRFYQLFVKLFLVSETNNTTQYGTKRHYLKKITGLNALSESSSFESSKVLTDYGKDIITLTTNEDITMYISELMYLYKTLSWSKINGKQMIPPNLLRFNCEIIVSEVRKFKRVVKVLNESTNNKDNNRLNTNGLIENLPSVGMLQDNNQTENDFLNSLDENEENNELSGSSHQFKEIAEQFSKIIYRLHECTFFIPNLPHGDTLDLSQSEVNSGGEFSFVYKFSSSSFEKLKWTIEKNGAIPKTNIINNVNYNLSSDYLDNFVTNLLNGNVYVSDIWDMNKKGNLIDEIISSPLDKLTKNEQKKNNPLNEFKNKVIKALANEGNRQIIKRMRIVNNTFTKLRTSVGLGKMSEPTNIYQDDYYDRLLKNDLQNATRDFVGDSIKDILKK